MAKSTMPEQDTSSYIVTLVLGTHAAFLRCWHFLQERITRRAPTDWTFPGSTFRKHVDQILAAPVCFTTPTWSGANSVRGRAEQQSACTSTSPRRQLRQQ